MKCITCNTEINPQWRHAIETNICPFCGKYIMEEHLKNLFSTLRDTMDNLKNYPDQLDDWMLSNYNYIRTNSPSLATYLPKEQIKDLVKEQENKEFQDRKNKKSIITIATENGEEEVLVEKIQDDTKTNEFFKRAQVIRAGQSASEKNNHLKKMVQQIKKSGSPSINESGDLSTISPEMIQDMDPDAAAEYMSHLEDGNEINSSIAPESEDDIPSIVLNMANQAGTKSGSHNSADLVRLQNQLNKSHRGLDSDSKGSFSRS